MMGEKKIRWGMIGTGNVTERKSGPAFSKIPGSELVAVGNRSRRRQKTTQNGMGLKPAIVILMM